MSLDWIQKLRWQKPQTTIERLRDLLRSAEAERDEARALVREARTLLHGPVGSFTTSGDGSGDRQADWLLRVAGLPWMREEL